jgi:hypothetical protein
VHLLLTAAFPLLLLLLLQELEVELQKARWDVDRHSEASQTLHHQVQYLRSDLDRHVQNKKVSSTFMFGYLVCCALSEVD